MPDGSLITQLSLTLQLERAVDIQPELEELAREEHKEMEVGWRPFGPDWESIFAMQRMGTFHILTARKGYQGELVGYLTWMLDFDTESYGTLIVHQCAWFVKKGNFRVAVRMFDWARDEWERLGVRFAYLHNTEFGRGKTLGKFFEKRGAVHVSNTYALRLRG